MYRLLLVDDDVELCQLLDEYLTQEGFNVQLAHSGDRAAELVSSNQYDLMILDVMLPQMNGFDVLRKVREFNPLPILMLTARGDDIDRVVGLEMGADDYLTKPCNPRELVARIRSIIRRFEMVPSQVQQADNKSLKVGDLTVEHFSRRILKLQQEIELTTTEFDILALLLNSAGQLVTREAISEQCLGRRLLAYDRSIDMHVSNIRKKLGQSEQGQERIKTIRGTGYQYVAV